MNSMFAYCSSLTSLNLSNFDTSKVIDMPGMFLNCSSLTSLDLSNFNTSNIKNMISMFDSCINLDYINLYNFDESNLENCNGIFHDVPENIVICINGNIAEKIFQNIANTDCIVIDCSNDWKSKQKKIINNNNECIDICNNNTLYKYEYKRKCFENCTYYYYLDNDKIFHCTFNSSCPKEYPKLANNKK